MTPEQIVRALAAASPIASHGNWCELCPARYPTDVDEHAADCPWRLAVEWVAKQNQPRSPARTPSAAAAVETFTRVRREQEAAWAARSGAVVVKHQPQADPRRAE